VEATTSGPESVTAGGRPLCGAAVRLGGLFEEHASLVLGLCRSLLRNAHDAEDAAQQTFLSAYRSLLSGNEPREPAAWLATIARHECGARAQQRMREPLPAAEYEVEGGGDPFDATVKSADVESLRRAIAQLPRQQREAFVLREFSGFSYEELAVALGVSGPAVESLLFRARRHLRLSLRSALAPANGLLWLPLRLRDLLSSAPEVPVTAKLASAGGVVLVSTSTVALVPHAHHHGHRQPRPAKVMAAALRPADPRIARKPVTPRSSAVERVSSTSGRTERRVREDSGRSAGEGNRSRPEPQQPENESVAQRPEGERTGDGGQASAAGPTTSGEIASASDGDRSSGDSGSSLDSGSSSDSNSSLDSGSTSESTSSSDSGTSSQFP
jgi:RNA polymerase sigma-70 factor (ECF subfamily)